MWNDKEKGEVSDDTCMAKCLADWLIINYGVIDKKYTKE